VRRSGAAEGPLVVGTTMMLSRVLMRVVPFFMSLFVAFFGRLIAHIVRSFAVFWSATAPAMLPVLVPYMETGESDITPAKFLQVLGAVFAGGLAMFVSVKNRSFGMRVQSMSVGAFAVTSLTPTIEGYIRDEYPMMVSKLDWIILIASGAAGVVIGAIGLKLESSVDIVSTAMIGVYAALQIVASLGLEFTKGLGVGDGDDSGCRSTTCFVTLGSCVAVLLLAIWNQVKFKKVPTVEVPDDAGKMKRCGLRIYNLVFTLLEPCFIMNSTLEDFGNEGADHEAAKQKAIAAGFTICAFAANVCAVSFSASMVAATVELFISGVYTQAGPIKKLGVILLGISFLVLVGSVYGALAYTMPIEAPERRKRMKIYFAIAMAFAPVTGMCALLCFVLSDPDYLHIPWVQDFTGIDMRKISQQLVRQHVNLTLSANNVTNTSVSAVAPAALVQYGDFTLGEVISEQEAMARLIDEMPTSAWSMVYATISLGVVIIMVGKSLGGFRFVAVALTSFTALINLANGIGIGFLGWILNADEGGIMSVLGQKLSSGNATVDDAVATGVTLKARAAADAENFDATQANLLNTVLGVASFMIIASLLGLVGAKLSDNIIGRTLLKVYGLVLTLILLVLIAIIIAGAYCEGLFSSVPMCAPMPPICV
jgi:hypothetical protein